MMLIDDLDDVTYDLEVDGEQVRRTLRRRVWERGGWATVALAYEERGPGDVWKPAKLALIRLQRSRGAWKKHAAITLRGSDALQLAETLGEWELALTSGLPDEPDAPDAPDDPED
jgi:hypothetical protein